VAREINFSDHYMNIGCKIVKDAAIKTNHVAGDGTTTATVLAAQFARDGMKLISKIGGYDPHLLKVGMNLALQEVLAALDANKRTIKGGDEIFNVATISANNDAAVGKVIREAFEGIGDLGIVTIGTSLSETTKVKFSSGLEIGSGFISSVFGNQKDGSCLLENPKILMSLAQISDYKELMPALDYCSKNKAPLAIIAPAFDEEVEAFIVSNFKAGKIKCCLIKTPGFSQNQLEDYTTDIAVLTGSKPWHVDGLLPEMFDTKHFGACDQIRVWPTRTVIAGAAGSDEDLSAYCDKIVAELETEKENMSQAQIDTYKERLAKLSGGIATIEVGATTEIEMTELKHRYEDAVNSVRAAISDGVVVGGGCALAHVAKAMKEPKLGKEWPRESKESIIAGYKLVRSGILSPLKKIVSNAAKSADRIVDEVQAKKFEFGYNAKFDKIQNLYDAGVIDPVKVTKTALCNAVSIASTLLTMECVVTPEYKNVQTEANDAILDELSVGEDSSGEW
jgi:chaperonin GroEL